MIGIHPFSPSLQHTIAQPNAIASAGGTLPVGATQVALYNNSALATVFFVCNGGDNRDAAVEAVIPAGATRGSMPIGPGQSVLISVPSGPKSYRTIATAADGTLFITPGKVI